MSYELRAHTADVAIAATGATLESVFAAFGDGLAAAACEEWPTGGDRYPLEVSAEGLEALLFDYLDELLYVRDTEHVLPVDTAVESVTRTGDAEWRVSATARGIPLDEVQAREIKAITYSDMALVETDTGWDGYVVVDV